MIIILCFKFSAPGVDVIANFGLDLSLKSRELRVGNIVSRLVKERIREINTIDKEDNYIKNKFKD